MTTDIKVKKAGDLSFKTISQAEMKPWLCGAAAWSQNELAFIYLHEILTGEYPLEKAREDILSFRHIGNNL